MAQSYERNSSAKFAVKPLTFRFGKGTFLNITVWLAFFFITKSEMKLNTLIYLKRISVRFSPQAF